MCGKILEKQMKSQKPGTTKFNVCDLLLQVHTSCRDLLPTKCPLGLCKVSVIPPTALNSIDSDGKSLQLLLFVSIVTGKEQEQELRSIL